MTWLRSITARSLRHLDRVDVDLTPGAVAVERLHLVLVGPNGSGKSSLLSAIAEELGASIDGRAHPAAALDGRHGDEEARERELKLAHLGRPLRLRWAPDARSVPEAFAAGRLVLVHLPVPREVRWDQAPKPSPTDTDPKRPDARVSARLPQLLVNRKTEQTLARESGDPMRAKVHEAWLLRVQSSLRKLLHQPELSLAFDAAGFHLDLPDGRRMHFDELSRGHASAVAIWAELMMRVEAARARADDPGLEPCGVVLVDAPEADLDPRLQRELLPVLAELYPRVQLVVATHSPLVAMSLENAVVYDLVRRRASSSADVRRGGVEALLAQMLGLEAAKPQEIRAAKPQEIREAKPQAAGSIRPAPPPPPPGRTKPPPPPGAAARKPTTLPPPPAKLPPKGASSRPRRTTLGGPGPWSDD